MGTRPHFPSGDTFRTPSWVHDAVFYQIFPDRFARSSRVPKPSHLEPWDSPPTRHGFKGGDLIGVVEHLDYLQDLGVSAIYFCPLFQSTANHRYHTYDYLTVDPILGGNAALQTLLQEAHRRGIRIVLDGVFNHASRGFFQFNHILENGPDSPYIDWFTVRSWPLHPYGSRGEDPGYESWWNLPDLPKFRTETPAVREYLMSVAEHWVRQGIDGWRLDVPNEIEESFWPEFRARVKAVNPEAYIVGEIWRDAAPWVGPERFDAVMNYVFTRACLGFCSGAAGPDQGAAIGTAYGALPSLDAQGLAAIVDGLIGGLPWTATLAQLNLLGSHDTPRFLTMVRGDEAAFRLATLFQMTYPGAPCIYYGDEIGMTGGRDPGSRGAFPWARAAWNEALHSYVKRCVALRRSYPVLRSGEYLTLEARGRLYVSARRSADDVAIVALNAGSGAESVDLPGVCGLSLRNLESGWGASAFELVDGGVRGWTVPARSGAVLIGKIASDGQGS
jgi:glycosidase